MSIKIMEIGIVLLPLLVIVLLIFFYIVPQLQMQKESEERMLKRFEVIQSGHYTKETDSVKQDSKLCTQTDGNKVQGDSIKSKFVNTSIDSLSVRLSRLEKEKEILINDIRQETNNSIEKQNLQLTFWLSIIAIFGTLIPIFIQYRLYLINRDKLTQEIAYYRDFVRSHALHNIAGNFSYVADTSIVVDSKDRNLILIQLIKESSEILEEIIESLTINYRHIFTPDIVSLLLQSLIQTSIIANSVRKLGIERKYDREFEKTYDSINTAINMVVNMGKGVKSVNVNLVIRHLHCVAYNLYSLLRCLP